MKMNQGRVIMMKEHNNFASIKSHKKLYKSGKTWMVATLLTVGLAGGAVVTGTTNAHADEVTPAQATGTIQAVSQKTAEAQNTINNLENQGKNQASQEIGRAHV